MGDKKYFCIPLLLALYVVPYSYFLTGLELTDNT